MPLRPVSLRAKDALLRLHESGMGYQIVQSNRDIFVVFNASVGLPLEELRGKEFSAADYRLLSGERQLIAKSAERELPIGDDVHLVFSCFLPAYKLARADLGLTYSERSASPPASLFPTKGARAYYRFSAFAADKRVDPLTGDLLPGSYATTYNDIHHVPSGFAAVGRYALPNPASARNVFTLLTATIPSIVGTASPNFGQAGGGVEVFFSSRAVNTPGSPFSIEVG